MDNQCNVDIDISLQDPEWEKLGGVEKVVEESVKLTLKSAILPKIVLDRDTEVSIVLANNDLLHVLNREYRDKDKPSNILTFATLDSEEPVTDGPLNLGDVFLSYETVMEEATDEGKFILDHVRHLIVHGVLHLLGYDHKQDDEATDMETLEIRILERMNVQNPYTKADF
ncbi:MAG: rRNA maturation RNase YbeY [Pseudomonadota bacterium]